MNRSAAGVFFSFLLAFGEATGERTMAQANSPCPPGKTTLVTALSPTMTEVGMVGLLLDESGCYLLTDDLLVPESLGDGVLVTAEHVKFDLGGHTIEGVNAGPGTMVTAFGFKTLTLSNGSLLGGHDGVWVQDGTAKSILRLENLHIDGSGSSSYRGLTTIDIDTIEILSSRVFGVDTAAWIRGARGGSIVDSEVRAAENAVLGVLDNFEILDSFFRADDPLRLGSDNLIRGSTLIAGSLATVALSIDSHNRVVDNLIDGGDSVSFSIHLMGDGNTILNNDLVGGNEAAVRVDSDRNRVDGNIITPSPGHAGRLDGVDVVGRQNQLSDNLLSDLRCAFLFRNEGGNIYRGNTVVDSGEAVCGLINRDVGGNDFPGPICGNDVSAAAETCDGSDLNGERCQTQGFVRGSLGCNETCDGFDVSGCRD